MFFFSCLLFFQLTNDLFSQDNMNVISKGRFISLKPSIANALQELKKGMKYPFIIDFLVNTNRKQDYFDDLEDKDTTEIKLGIKDSINNVIEKFSIGEIIYNYLKIKSLSGDKVYYILVDSNTTAEGVGRLDLFEQREGSWCFCDSFTISYRYTGLFEISKLNGHDVINVKKVTDATGYYREEEAYLGISNNRFKSLFRFTRIEFYQPEGEDVAKWKVGKISFADLNQDGFIDIEEKEKMELVEIPDYEWSEFASTKLWLRTKKSDYFYSLNARKVISEKKHRYIWNQKMNYFNKSE